ncbi:MULTISPECIES: hypothetical protein [Acinetobacter]|nr:MULTISPECIES: hypothetical protein [Acinetobacter]
MLYFSTLIGFELYVIKILGGNCGSCLPEIRGLIKACQAEGV